MTRGKYPRRPKVSPPDPAVEARFLLRWSARDLYHETNRFPPLDAGPIFGSEAPLSLEVGCGTGEFLCRLAARSPQMLFLGVDIATKPLYRAVETAAEMDLQNIKFLRANIKLLYPLLAPKALQAVYFHFPVPARKSRVWRHQIFGPDFLDHIYRSLLPGGWLSVMTDNPVQHQKMLTVAQADARFQLRVQEPFRLTMDEDLKSHNQRIWESRGRKTLRFELEKPVADPGLAVEPLDLTESVGDG